MFANAIPRLILLFAATFMANLLVVSAWTKVAIGQPELTDSNLLAEIPIERWAEIQEELQYLREQNAERQAWEDSMMSQLSTASLNFPSEDSPASEESGSDPVAYELCQQSCCASESSKCGCQCPLPESKCIDCPRVSTLKPHYNIHFFGALKTDMVFNSARPISPGTPFFLTPDSLTGLDQSTLDIHARQSTLGALFTGPQMGCFQSGGMVVAMFFNDSVIVDQYGFLPLQAWGELKNENWRFAGGLQFDVFSPGIPTVLPFSALAGSGNSGNSFRGQLRLERFLHPCNDVQWTLQLALSEPISSTIDPSFRISEDNGWPNVEGRIALGLGPVEGAGLATKRRFELGVSGIVGQIRTTPPPPNDRVVADVWGAAVDFRWKISDCCGFMGEIYAGQTLGTYNAGILQNISTDTLEGVQSAGGWAEVFFYWTPCLHSHTGYGIDDPKDSDVATAPAALGRTRNTTLYSNLLWDINQSFRVGFELTWRETNYRAPALRDNEGAGFHTQFQWAF